MPAFDRPERIWRVLKKVRTWRRGFEDAVAGEKRARQQLERMMLGGAAARLDAYAREIARHTHHLRFGGRQPIVDAYTWARIALEKGLDPWWAVSWVLSGYPVPPRFLEQPIARGNAWCQHARQMTPWGDALPCAHPSCDYRVSNRTWRTAKLPDVLNVWVGKVEVPMLEVVEWERIEYRDQAGASQWFWRVVA